MGAQLKVWRNDMREVKPKLNGAKTNGAATNPTTETTNETTTLWNSMEKQIQQWLATTAAMRMDVGADVQWQLETLHALETTAGETLLAFKNGQNGARDALQETAERALGDLKHAVERVFPT